MTRDPMQELIEAVAQAIYEQWKDQDGYEPWAACGNSLKQDDARQIARAAVARAEQAQGVEGGWLPIETPPPRSLPTLVSRPAYSADQFGPVAAFVDVAGVWRVWLSEGGDSPVPFEPTHWRPLPPPPGPAATPKSATGEVSSPDPKGAL